MKIAKYCIAVLLLLGASGCLFVEKIETRVRFLGKNSKTGEPAQTQVTILYYNVSTDAETDQKLQEDFEELLKSEKAEGSEEEVEDGMIIKKRHVYVEKGKINVRAEAVPEHGKIEDVIANGERILVLERESDNELAETNGKVFKTEENYIIVWPESLEEIYWILRLHPESDADKAAIERNRPKLVRMLEAHSKQQ